MANTYRVTIPADRRAAFIRECNDSRMVQEWDRYIDDTFTVVFRDQVKRDGWRSDEYTVTVDMCDKWLNALQRFGTIASYKMEE